MDELKPLKVDETPKYDKKPIFIQNLKIGHIHEKHNYELVRENKDGYYTYTAKNKKSVSGMPYRKPVIITENIVPELEAYTDSKKLKEYITSITPKADISDKVSIRSSGS